MVKFCVLLINLHLLFVSSNKYTPICYNFFDREDEILARLQQALPNLKALFTPGKLFLEPFSAPKPRLTQTMSLLFADVINWRAGMTNVSTICNGPISKKAFIVGMKQMKATIAQLADVESEMTSTNPWNVSFSAWLQFTRALKSIRKLSNECKNFIESFNLVLTQVPAYHLN